MTKFKLYHIGFGMWLLLIFLVAGNCLVYAQKAPTVISLEESLDRALKYDVDYRIALLEWENTEIEITISSLNQAETEEERLRAEIDYRRAQNDFTTVQKDVIIGIAKQYYDLQWLKKQTATAELEVELAGGNYRLIEEKVKTGQLPERDLLEEKNNYHRSLLKLEQSIRDYEQSQIKFFLTAGMDKPEGSLDLSTDVPDPVLELSLEEINKLASSDHFILWERETRIRLSEINLERLKTQDTGFLEIDQAKNDHQIVLLLAEKAEHTFIQDLHNRWFDLKDSMEEIEMTEIEHKLIQESYDRSVRQFEMGLIGESQLLRDRIALMRSKTNLLRQKSDYLVDLIGLRGELGLQQLWPETIGINYRLNNEVNEQTGEPTPEEVEEGCNNEEK